jgi:hypothetical protein
LLTDAQLTSLFMVALAIGIYATHSRRAVLRGAAPAPTS